MEKPTYIIDELQSVVCNVLYKKVNFLMRSVLVHELNITLSQTINIKIKLGDNKNDIIFLYQYKTSGFNLIEKINILKIYDGDCILKFINKATPAHGYSDYYNFENAIATYSTYINGLKKEIQKLIDVETQLKEILSDLYAIPCLAEQRNIIIEKQSNDK